MSVNGILLGIILFLVLSDFISGLSIRSLQRRIESLEDKIDIIKVFRE